MPPITGRGPRPSIFDLATRDPEGLYSHFELLKPWADRLTSMEPSDVLQYKSLADFLGGVAVAVAASEEVHIYPDYYGSRT